MREFASYKINDIQAFHRTGGTGGARVAPLIFGRNKRNLLLCAKVGPT